MRLHVPQNDAENDGIAVWAGNELRVTFAPPYMALASLDHRGMIVGAVILNNYSGANVDLTAVGPGSFGPSMVRQISSYVFDQLTCSRVTLRTRRSNHRVRKLLGRHFKFETPNRNWFGDEDALQFRMCRDECPWLEKK